jgi:hypothetical protein
VRAQALALLGVSAVFVVQAWRHALRRRGRCRGRITRMLDDGDGILSLPEVTFTSEGLDYTFVASARHKGEERETGQEVTVAFDPREPQSAVIAAPFHMYVTPTLLSIAWVVAAFFLLE